MQQDLPIERIRTTLLSSLANCPRVIVTADPGSGKSTILPQFFMTQGKKVVVAQPRRIAARSLAKYVSQSFGEAPGQSIGYRVRHENCTSKTTQLEYVTDGMLVRLLQADPELSEFDVVILDEFHERSTDLDLCLALLMELQSALRPELELILMSATLDTGHLSNWLKAPHLHAPGRPFPNHIERINTPIPRSKLTAEITKYILRTIKDQETKNCLVFLPGVKDIESIHRQLKGRTDIRISQLYGQQKLTAQSQ
ncbi:MAG: DEAD/DEAH box helicase, partial [Bradymonadia bacterium]